MTVPRCYQISNVREQLYKQHKSIKEKRRLNLRKKVSCLAAAIKGAIAPLERQALDICIQPR